MFGSMVPNSFERPRKLPIESYNNLEIRQIVNCMSKQQVSWVYRPESWHCPLQNTSCFVIEIKITIIKNVNNFREAWQRRNLSNVCSSFRWIGMIFLEFFDISGTTLLARERLTMWTMGDWHWNQLNNIYCPWFRVIKPCWFIGRQTR